jgi:hypothetical protein
MFCPRFFTSSAHLAGPAAALRRALFAWSIKPLDKTGSTD